MPYIITDGCVNCGACEGVCPVGAIMSCNDKRVIDNDCCIICGSCVPNCPVDAIKETDS